MKNEEKNCGCKVVQDKLGAARWNRLHLCKQHESGQLAIAVIAEFIDHGYCPNCGCDLWNTKGCPTCLTMRKAYDLLVSVGLKAPRQYAPMMEPDALNLENTGESFMEKFGLRELFEIIHDHGNLSGGQMARKWNMDPFEGYGWVEKKARAVQKRLQSAGKSWPGGTVGSSNMPAFNAANTKSVEDSNAARAALAFIEKHKAALIGIECTSAEYEAAIKPFAKGLR